MRIRNETRGSELASQAQVASSPWSRLKGLLGRSSLQMGEALLLERSTSIHTAFMRFAIDVVYVDRSGQVVKVVSDMKPFRMSGVLRGGRSVIELPSGTVVATGTVKGDQLAFDP